MLCQRWGMRALLIDLDGVLRHRDVALVAEAEREAGVPVGSVMAAAFEPELLRSVVTGVMTQEEWEAELCRVLPVAVVGKVMGDVGYVDPDVLQIVDEVRGRAKVCLVSNASSRLHADLDRLGLRDHLDFVVSSAELGIAKPDPRIFRAAAELVGVGPQDCVLVDDSSTVTAAAAAIGMAAHTFTSADRLREWIAQR